MVKKIVGIFICMLLIINALSATGAINVHTSGHVREKKDLEPYLSTPVKSSGIINIEIEGQVTYVLDSGNLLGGAIQVNDSITGKYTYDSGTPDSNPDPTIGLYEYNTSTFGIKLEAGGFVFETDPNDVVFRIQVINNFYGGYWDSYVVSSSNNSILSNGLIVDTLSWWLQDATCNALSSDALPTKAPVLSDWDENTLFINVWDPSPPYDSVQIKANVTKVTTLSKSKTRDIHFTTQPILIWILERFPNLFPILRYILGFQ